jgi:transposase
VIGVDTHRDTLAAAVTDSVGGLLARTSVRADAVGYQRLLGFARVQVLDAAIAPWLLELSGLGPIGAAQVLVSWSHAGRLRSEAAFA